MSVEKKADAKVEVEYDKFRSSNHEINQVDEDYFKALTKGVKELSGERAE